MGNVVLKSGQENEDVVEESCDDSLCSKVVETQLMKHHTELGNIGFNAQGCPRNDICSLINVMRNRFR